MKFSYETALEPVITSWNAYLELLEPGLSNELLFYIREAYVTGVLAAFDTCTRLPVHLTRIPDDVCKLWLNQLNEMLGYTNIVEVPSERD